MYTEISKVCLYNCKQESLNIEITDMRIMDYIMKWGTLLIRFHFFDDRPQNTYSKLKADSMTYLPLIVTKSIWHCVDKFVPLQLLETDLFEIII